MLPESEKSVIYYNLQLKNALIVNGFKKTKFIL